MAMYYKGEFVYICKDNLLIMKTEIYEYDRKSIPFSIVRGMMRYNKII